MNSLIALDHAIFKIINQDWSNSFFDWLMPNITDLHREPAFLIAMIPLLAFWVYRQRTYALKWILILILSIGAADGFSYRVIKKTWQRDRPQFTGIEVNLRTHRHSGSSFPSNHTANVFAAATVLSSALPTGAPIFFLVAALVGYSRVYVGVHFPVDVTAGAIIGTLLALLIMFIFRKWLRKAVAGKP